jgi:shikimate 5-dehydrogenase|tara:strand:- start:267 stop:896 length:630 start_codon:yes stop_codon:yes gene_type:complete
MLIDKDTKLYCSFARVAGSTGCAFHNAGFKKHNINAIYKSFSVRDIYDAVQCMRVLDIKGAGVTMPYKTDVIRFLDDVDQTALDINACNTLINNNGKIKGYNTDVQSAIDYLQPLELKHLVVLGSGGYAKAVIRACRKLDIDVKRIVRESWHQLPEVKNHTVFNCTPVENIKLHESNKFIDCIATTPTGKILADKQAAYQFKLYTGIDY